MNETEFVQKISEIGGNAYVVGGWVRDRVLGGVPHDRDYVVTGLTEGVFRVVFPAAFATGAGFPVYRLEIGGVLCEVALARSEIKTGSGYRGFDVIFSPHTSIEDDLYRRDTTINAMALDLRTGELIDPYGGKKDVHGGVIRAVSEHFADDPVRALRAARQSAQLGFRIEPGTIAMMRSCRDELGREPAERMVKELTLALACKKPSVFFVNLLAADILDVSFPGLFALVGVSQYLTDAFVHTMEVLDRTSELSERVEVRFSALSHNLGKVLKPREQFGRNHTHDERGLAALREWNRQYTLPRLWVKCATFVIREHKRAWSIVKPGEIVDFLDRLNRSKIGFDGFTAVLRADRGALPDFLKNYEALMEAMDSVKASDAPDDLEGVAIGAWIRERMAAAVAAVMKNSGAFAERET
jgi:tRNA nucleotidyltransferase (CCA-adding enzyme)